MPDACHLRMEPVDDGERIAQDRSLSCVVFDVARTVDDQRGLVGMMDYCTGDASQQHRAQTGKTSGTHHDRGGLMSVGGLDDRLPFWSRRLDGGCLGLEARFQGQAGALVGDGSGVLGRGTVELKEIEVLRASMWSG